jgi:hypothetical protein
MSPVSKSKVDNALTDEYVEQIKAYAKEDAQAGEYMRDGFINLRSSQCATYVSPDRSSAMAQVNGVINKVSRINGTWHDLFDLLVPGYTAKVSKGAMWTYAQVFDENGEMISSYNGYTGQWTSCPTEAEMNFNYQTTQIYYAAWKEAKAEMTAAQQQPQSVQNTSSDGFDVKV